MANNQEATEAPFIRRAVALYLRGELKKLTNDDSDDSGEASSNYFDQKAALYTILQKITSMKKGVRQLIEKIVEEHDKELFDSIPEAIKQNRYCERPKKVLKTFVHLVDFGARLEQAKRTELAEAITALLNTVENGKWTITIEDEKFLKVYDKVEKSIGSKQALEKALRFFCVTGKLKDVNGIFGPKYQGQVTTGDGTTTEEQQEEIDDGDAFGAGGGGGGVYAFCCIKRYLLISLALAAFLVAFLQHFGIVACILAW